MPFKLKNQFRVNFVNFYKKNGSPTCSENFTVSRPFQNVNEVELRKPGVTLGHSTNRLHAVDHVLCQLDAVYFTVSTLVKAIITGRSSVIKALFSAKVLSKVLKLQ